MIISVSRLAEVAMPDFCPRCFWIKLKMGWKLPFQRPMPGILGDIDRHVKNVVRTHYEEKGMLPQWFPYLGRVTKLEEAPGWRDFCFSHPRLGITIRGEMDEILQLNGCGYHILDYKTARYTAAQDKFLPVFEAQLNAYAYIAERGGFFSPITGLNLVYLEPDTDSQFNRGLMQQSSGKLILGFIPQVKSVEIKPDSFTEDLLQKCADIASLLEPPKPVSQCQNCRLLQNLSKMVSVQKPELIKR
jgi:hypothetical protein